jgi:two-component system response regulator HydG
MPDDLPPEILRMVYILDDDGLAYNEAKKKIIDEFNRAVISRALLKHGGNVTRASEELRLDRANFQRLMRRCRISADEFREET